jgi:large subunit ribosomal protein L31
MYSIVYMKEKIHPKTQRQVIFHDTSSDTQFLTSSTIHTTLKGTLNGTEYDLYQVEISSASHPFYTGEQKIMDTAGRVDKFKARAAKAEK